VPEIPTAEVIAQRIPHSWFDAIGRIIPGAFLLGGVFDAGYSSPLVSQFSGYLLRYSLFGPAVGLLVFATAAWITGFLLATLSYLVDCVSGCLWPFRWKDIPEPMQKVMKSQFTPRLSEREHQQILRARDCLLHLLWTRPEGLQIAMLASKRDAEALVSRSVAVAAVLLVFLNKYLSGRWRGWPVFVVTAMLGLWSYSYYRRRSLETPLDAIALLKPGAP